MNQENLNSQCVAGDRPDAACSAIDHHRAALAEARRRIITRYEHVETWLKQPVSEIQLANWGGIIEGLRQALQLIGYMWDRLPDSITGPPDAACSAPKQINGTAATLAELNRALDTLARLNEHTGTNYTPGLMKQCEAITAAMTEIAKRQNV